MKVKKAIKIILWIIGVLGAAAGLWTLNGCSTTHTVSQSSQSSSYIKGDTTVTEVTIKYEQIGKAEK